MEFTHALLEQMLSPELGRFDVVGQDAHGWKAYDSGTDESIRAPSREGLIRKLALASDHVDLTTRPRYNGRPVLIAQVIPTDAGFSWEVIDALERRYEASRVYPTREAAVAGLSSSYDDN